MTCLIVVSGLPGTGKTTLATALATRLRAVYLRVDVVETPLIASGIDVGPLGYEIVRGLADSNLGLGLDVVVDLVNPIPITRRMWAELSMTHHADLIVFECTIPDPVEHRRRVESRRPDLPGQRVPTWREVVDREYLPWDEGRDGPRIAIDMTDRERGIHAARVALGASG